MFGQYRPIHQRGCRPSVHLPPAAITLLAACRLPMLPTVIIAVASSGLLGLLMN